MKKQKSKIQKQGTDFRRTGELSFGPIGLRYLRVIQGSAGPAAGDRGLQLSREIKVETQMCWENYILRGALQREGRGAGTEPWDAYGRRERRLEVGVKGAQSPRGQRGTQL